MIINPYAFGVAYDPDAQAFFTASGLTGTTNLNAINQLVVDLKGYGIWTKMKAIYPIIGGTAALHKWNLKDPQDTNAAFRLTFNGGFIHSSTGAKGNGTNGYMDTNLNWNTITNLDNVSIGIYFRTDATIQGGNGVIQGATFTHLWPSYAGQIYVNINSNTGYQAGNSLQKLFLQTSRISSASFNIKINNNAAVLSLFASNSKPNGNFYISARNTNPGVAWYHDQEIAFSYIGDGLTTTELTNFYTAVQAYQTTLSRQV